MNRISLLILLTLVACKGDTNLENFPVVPSQRISDINKTSDENCDPTLPDMGEASTLGMNLSQLMCDKKCSNNYEVIPKEKDPQGYLAFPIPGHLGVGRCRGHAIVTQQFNMLARFNPKSSENDCGPKNMTAQCKRYYDQVIERITKDNKVAEIAGFESLAEFSSNPYIYKKLYSKVIGFSHKYYANPAHLEEQDGSRKNSVFNEIINRVKKNQQPYIGIKGLGVADHAILATDIKKVGRQEIICVSDSNQRSFNPLREDHCENYIQMVGGVPTYKTRRGQTKPLYKFNLYSDEDKRLETYVQAWQEECQRQKSSNQECLPQKKEENIRTGEGMSSNSESHPDYFLDRNKPNPNDSEDTFKIPINNQVKTE